MAEAKEKKNSQFKEIVRRFFKNKLATLGFIMFLVVLFFALFAGLFGTYEESITQNIMQKLKVPSAEHWFGTDNYGRDLFLRCIYGARISLSIGFSASILSATMGTIIGLTAAFYGGKYENFMMRLLDVFSAVPTILLAICVVSALGTSTVNLVLAMAIARTPGFARQARGSALTVAGQEYVEAARCGGTGDVRIMLRHILPNAMAPLIISFTGNISSMILQNASLSFLGLGVPAPAPEWGALISGAKAYMRNFPHMIWFPGICIIVAALSISLMGDGVRDALDPKLKS
jgi:peptide/nickel transport system permease protein